MFCTKCGSELRESDRYCPQCGVPLAGSAPKLPPARLALDKTNKKIAGVCAGFARYFGSDVILMRIIFLVLAFGTGIGFIAYLVAWIVMPSDRNLELTAPAAVPQVRTS